MQPATAAEVASMTEKEIYKLNLKSGKDLLRTNTDAAKAKVC